MESQSEPGGKQAKGGERACPKRCAVRDVQKLREQKECAVTLGEGALQLGIERRAEIRQAEVRGDPTGLGQGSEGRKSCGMREAHGERLGSPLLACILQAALRGPPAQADTSTAPRAVLHLLPPD